MDKKNCNYVPQADFSEQTPEMLIGNAKAEANVEKAYLSREDSDSSGFSQNTCTHE